MVDLLKGELQFHLRIKQGDVGEYILLPGDPERVEKIAAYLDGAKKVAQNREYTIYTGSLCGVSVSVASTGIGGPSAAIAVEELANCGAHTFIRIGTSGGIDKKVVGGDLIIATSSVRAEGTSYEYLPKGYPAAADFEVVSALVRAANEEAEDKDGKRYHVGIIQSKDSFYGECEPERMPVSDMLQEKWKAYEALGCLTSEMEAASIFAVALTRHVRAGAVLTALWNVQRPKYGLDNPVCHDSSRAIRCAIGAIKYLIEKDKQLKECYS